MKTLKSQMNLAFFLLASIPICVLVLVYFFTTARGQQTEFTQTRRETVQRTVSRLDSQLAYTRSMANQIVTDRGMAALLRQPEYDTRIATRAYLEFRDRISDRYMAMGNDIRAMLVLGDNGLDIRNGPDAAFYQRAEVLSGTDTAEIATAWSGLAANPYRHSGAERVVRYHSPIYLQGESRGDLLVYFTPAYFLDCYNDSWSGARGEFFLLGARRELLAGDETRFADEEVQSRILGAVDAGGSESAAQTSFLLGGEQHLLTVCPAPDGWTAVELISIADINRPSRSFSLTALVLLLVALCFCYLLSAQLTKNLTKPLRRIVAQVGHIGGGKFRIEPLPETGTEEIRTLSENINKMQKDIMQLLDDNLQKEKDQHALEIQMLQNQIHPHFLHNTLNSIKLMAVLQGATGIERMVASLSRILRYALTQSHEQATVSQEIAVFEDYMHIQRIHYKGRLSYRTVVEDETLRQNLVPRFILQPVVENSVMHGFVQAGSTGEVTLRVAAEYGHLVVEITDNGSGIPPQALDQLRRKLECGGADDAVPRGGLGIGLANVHRRIRLMKGPGYGLSIASEPGRFTRVTMLLPLEGGDPA